MIRFTARALLTFTTLNLICVFVFFGGRIFRSRSKLPEVVIRHELGLNKPSSYALKQDLSGVMFQADGISVRKPLLNTALIVSLVYSFSPGIQRSALSIFQPYAREGDILIMHPAMVYSGGKIITLTELRIREQGRRRMTAQDKVTYLFLRTYDRNFTVLDRGTLLEVDFPSTYTTVGAQRPYLFHSQDDVILSFTARGENSQHVYYTALHSDTFDSDAPPLDAAEMAYIETPIGACLAPVFAHGHINYIYSYDPLRLIQCSNVKGCAFVFKDGATKITDFGILIGGSPLELYTWPYHVGVANAKTVVKAKKKTLYTSHLVVMALDIPRILYVSQPLSLHDNIIRTVTFRDRTAAERYIQVSGIILETPDTISLATNINDVTNVILRLTGVQRLLADIIETDLMTPADMRHNPPPGTVQRNVMELIKEYTDTEVSVK
jgi:hypothetical protein